MKKSEITIGGLYVAKVSGKLTTVRVDAIKDRYTNIRGQSCCRQHYDVTNLKTDRKTTFRSAAKFRSVAKPVEGAPGPKSLSSLAAGYRS